VQVRPGSEASLVASDAGCGIFGQHAGSKLTVPSRLKQTRLGAARRWPRPRSLPTEAEWEFAARRSWTARSALERAMPPALSKQGNRLRASALKLDAQAGLEPATYGVLVGPAFQGIVAGLTSEVVAAWLWLFLPAPPARCPARCPSRPRSASVVSDVSRGSSSEATTRICALTAKVRCWDGDRLRCRYGTWVHGSERATRAHGEGWGLRQPCTRRPPAVDSAVEGDEPMS
jgi:hypothetical protein